MDGKRNLTRFARMLVRRIPMRFRRRGGRRRIIAPDGSEIVPTSKPQPDGTLVKALARGWRWQKLLDDGVYASVSEIGDPREHLEELHQPDPAAGALRLTLSKQFWRDARMEG